MGALPQVEINDKKTAVNVKWSDLHISRCNVKWLRFHCRCKRCVPEFSGMFPLDKDEYDDNLYITKAEIKDETLHIDIDKELMGNHTTILPVDWLKENCNCDACLERAIAESNFTFVEPNNVKVPRVAYETLNSQEGKFEFLKRVFDIGFCVIENAPKEDKLVVKMADTYGWTTMTEKTQMKKYFDVEFDPPEVQNAGPIYRQESPYYEQMPGVQIIHALSLDDSDKECKCLMVDLFQSAEIMRKESPEDFKALTKIPGRFEMKDSNREHPAWYEHTRTHFEVDYFGNIVTIYWNPVVEGTLRVYQEDEDPYYEAYAKYLAILNRKDLQFSVTLKENEILVMNNRRMGHAWMSSGPAKTANRKLQGSFVNIDDFKSSYMVVAHKLGKSVFSPKCGNRSWF